MKLSRRAGSTSNIFQIFIADSSSTTGAGLTGLTNASSSLTAYYHKDTDTTATAISLVTMTVGTFTSSGFKEIDATNMPGWYQFCPPDAALSTSGTPKSVSFHLKGATNMAPLPIEVDLDSQVDVYLWNGTAVSSPATAGIPDVNVKNINNVAAATPGASGGILISGSNSGTTTLGAITCTGSFTISDGLLISRSSSNTSAITATGNGTGSGAVFTSGSGATGDGIQATSNATNGNGLSVAGKGTGQGQLSTGGLTGNGEKWVGGGTSGHGLAVTTTSGDGFNLTPTAGHGITTTGQGTTKHGINATGSATTGAGISAVGGGTSGDGILISATSGHGINIAGGGTTKHGINSVGGATTSAGLALTGGGTSGAGLLIRTTSGHGIDVAATGTSMHGATITGGNGGTSDGLKCVAGTGGVDIRGNITGNLVGTVTTVTTVTNQLTAAQIATGIWQDATAGDFTATSSIGKSLYTSGVVPGGSGGLFIAGTNAATTITTALTTTFTGNLTGSVASVTGAVGSVTGSIGSIASGGITTASFGSGAINAAAINVDTGLIIRANTATGSSSSTLVLDASASATDNFYINDILVVTSGTGVGQARRISAYTGSSKTATVSPNWTTTPATNGTFTILPAARVDIASILGTASVGTAGYLGVDWGQVTNQSTSVNLSATTINLVNTATTLTNAPSDSSGTTTLLSRLTSGRATNLDNLDTAVSSRMATYTQPTGFLAATFPSGTIANTTNITAGTITTATNLTTNNDKTGYSLVQTFPTNFSSLSITSAGLVAITSNRKKGSAATFEFTMTDSTTGAVKTGLTVASVISKDGGTAASTSNSVSEIGLGQYQLVLTSSEMNANNIFMQFTASGAVTYSLSVQTQP